MKRMMILVAALFGFATTAQGLSLTVVSDQPSYTVGQTITLTVTADPSGGTAGTDILVGLTWLADAALTTTVSAGPQVAAPGTLGLLGALLTADGQADAFNQILNFAPVLPSGPFTSTVTLLADAPGLVTVGFGPGVAGDPLNFLGIGPGGLNGTSFSIVPEPGTLLLLGAGLGGLALLGRRHS